MAKKCKNGSLGKKIKTSAGGLKAVGITLSCNSKTGEKESAGREVGDAAKIIGIAAETLAASAHGSRHEKNTAPRVTRETSK